MTGGKRKPCGAKVHKDCAAASSASLAPIDVYFWNVSEITETSPSAGFKKGEKKRMSFSSLPHLARKASPLPSLAAPLHTGSSAAGALPRRLCHGSEEWMPCTVVLPFAWPLASYWWFTLSYIIYSLKFTGRQPVPAKYLPDLICPIKLWVW